MGQWDSSPYICIRVYTGARIRGKWVIVEIIRIVMISSSSRNMRCYQKNTTLSHALYVSPKLSRIAKAPSGPRSPVREAAMRIIELETEVNNGIAQIMRLKTEIGESIRSVNSIECETLLEMRYLTFMGWKHIASQLNYSQDYIYHLHQKALRLVRIPRV